MKTNTFILATTLGLLALTGITTYSMFKAKTLQTQLSENGLLTSQLTYHDLGLNLTGQSLVLYGATLTTYPNFFARRVQITDTHTTFKLTLNGIHGSLIRLFQQKEPYAFKHKILTYTPQEQLLQNPLITLAVAGYDILNADITLSAKLTTANQIICELEFKSNGKTKAHFISKITPHNPQLSVLQNLKGLTLPFRITYLDPEEKQRLDDYALSKNQSFVIQEQEFSFPFPI